MSPRKTYLEDVLSIWRVQLNGLFTPGLLGIGRKVVLLQVLMKSRYSWWTVGGCVHGEHKLQNTGWARSPQRLVLVEWRYLNIRICKAVFLPEFSCCYRKKSSITPLKTERNASSLRTVNWLPVLPALLLQGSPSSDTELKQSEKGAVLVCVCVFFFSLQYLNIFQLLWVTGNYFLGRKGNCSTDSVEG